MGPKMKIIYKYVLFTAIILHIQIQNIYCIDASQQELVHSFYTWYIQKEWFDPMQTGGRKPAIFNNEIYKYVSACTVERCRLEYKRMNIDSDYFTKSQGFDQKWLNSMTVSNPIQLEEHTSVILVDFDQASTLSLAVFVQKENTSYRIIRVEYLYGHF
jgi:hypothetical protein